MDAKSPFSHRQNQTNFRSAPAVNYRRLGDSDKRTKASFPNLFSRLLPGSLDEAFLAELKAEHTGDNLTSFDERLSSVIQAWENFAQEALAIRLVTDKWIAHFELEEKQSFPVDCTLLTPLIRCPK